VDDVLGQSWSPALMKILVPVMLVGAVGVRLGAGAWPCPRSVPQCGSVRHMVPVHSPLVSLVRYSFFCSSVPCTFSVRVGPVDSPGYIVQAQFAVPIMSSTNRPIEGGRPWPPYSGGVLSAAQPPSTYCA
jgi:hypothetical protein